MTAILLLFITGALLVTAEVFLPGGIAGAIGGFALLIGSVVAFVEYGALGGSIATLAALLLVGLMLYAELAWLPRTKFGRDLVVHATNEAQSQPLPASAEVVGQPAIALTTLSPSGLIEIAGKRYEAYCRSGHVARGTALKVIGVETFRLIVTENNTP